MNNSFYASNIRTATDAAGQTFGVWDDNGLLLMARWDDTAKRWSEAARISNAVNGRNIQLVAADLAAAKDGREKPVLVASWESGHGNESDVSMALGFYLDNGEIQWSDAIQLAMPGQHDSNHTLGTATVDGAQWILISSQSQVLNDPDGAVGFDESGADYNDSDINTLRIQVSQANKADGAVFYSDGETIARNLVESGAGQKVIGVSVNGRTVPVGVATRLEGLGTVTVNPDGSASFERSEETTKLRSEVLVTATLLNESAGLVSKASYAILPKEFESRAKEENSINGLYQLEMTVGNNKKSLHKFIEPITFNETDNKESVSRSTFTTFQPRGSTLSLRNYTGSASLSDTSLRSVALKAASTLLGSAFQANQNAGGSDGTTALMQQDNSSGSWSDVFGIGLWNTWPYQVTRNQPVGFGVSIGDSVRLGGGPALMANFPTNRWFGDGFNIGLHGNIFYRKLYDPANEASSLQVNSSLYLRLGRMTSLGGLTEKSRYNIIGTKIINKSYSEPESFNTRDEFGRSSRSASIASDYPDSEAPIQSEGNQPSNASRYSRQSSQAQRQANASALLHESSELLEIENNRESLRSSIKDLSASQSSDEQSYQLRRLAKYIQSQDATDQFRENAVAAAKARAKEVSLALSEFEYQPRRQRRATNLGAAQKRPPALSDYIILRRGLDVIPEENEETSSNALLFEGTTPSFASDNSNAINLNHAGASAPGLGGNVNLGTLGGVQVGVGNLFQVPFLSGLELGVAASENWGYVPGSKEEPKLFSKTRTYMVNAEFSGEFSIRLGTFGNNLGGNLKEVGMKYSTNGDPMTDYVADKNWSLFTLHAQAGMRGSLFGGGTASMDQPGQAPKGVETWLIWQPEENYNNALLKWPDKESSTGKFFQYMHYLSYLGELGSGVAGTQVVKYPYLAEQNRVFPRRVDPGSEGQSEIQNRSTGFLALSNVLGAVQAIPQIPWIVSSANLIFRNMRGFDREDFALGYEQSAFGSGSVGLLNNLVNAHANAKFGVGYVVPLTMKAKGGLLYDYLFSVGYKLGGLSRNLINYSDKGIIGGDYDGGEGNSILVNTGSLFLSSAALRLQVADAQGKPLSQPDAQALISGGRINLDEVAALSPDNEPLSVTLKGALIVPDGEVDQDGYLRNFHLALSGIDADLPLQLSIDRRSLLTGSDRINALNVQQYWKPILSRNWQDSEATGEINADQGSSQPLNVKPGQAIQVKLELEWLASAEQKLKLGSLVDGRFQGLDDANVLTSMPGSAELREESGSTKVLGLNPVVGLISQQKQAGDPYLAAFIVTAMGDDYPSFDFILEPEPGVITRGRAISSVGGGIERVDVLETSESALYKKLQPNSQWSGQALTEQLKARTQAGSDAVLALSVDPKSGDITGIEVAKGGSGSGYLAGGNGKFQQQLSGRNGTLLLEIQVEQGLVSRARVLKAEGSFDDGERLTLNNSVVGAGRGLALTPLVRRGLDLNRQDEMEVAIGSGQRYSGGWNSQAVLSYTQGGPKASTPINQGINLNLPIVTAAYGTPGAGWNLLTPFKDNPDAYDPGVDGYNFDAITNSSYLNKSIDGKTEVMVFAHSDLSAIKSEDDTYLLDTAVQNSKVYYSLYNGKDFDEDEKIIGWVPAQPIPGQKPGANRGLILEPFYAQAYEGHNLGIEPVPGPNDQLLAAWIHTSPDDETSIVVSVGQQVKTDDGDSDIQWGQTAEIPLGQLNAEEITDLSLSYLEGGTPSLSWSLATLMPYQASVLADEPLSYYRLDDLLSNREINSVGGSQAFPGSLVLDSELKSYSSPFEKIAEKSFVSTDYLGALWQPSLKEPGDDNPAAYFGGGEFMLFNNPNVDLLVNPSAQEPSGYTYELWFKADSSDKFGSLLDNGLYNPEAELPKAGSLKLPLYAERIATTDERGRPGWLVSVWMDEAASVKIPDAGLGKGLSPFNLTFGTKAQTLNFDFINKEEKLGSYASELPVFGFGGSLTYTTKDGVLTSLQANNEKVLIASDFVVDQQSPADDKTRQKSSKVLAEIDSKQITGWSLRKEKVDGVEKLIYAYGEDSDGLATLEAPINSGEWNHVYFGYSTDQLSGNRVAELWLNGELAGYANDNPVLNDNGDVISKPKAFDLNLLPISAGYNYAGLIDELVIHSKPLADPAEQLSGRLLSRYVNPKSASQATYFSHGSPLKESSQTDVNKLANWQWDQPQTFTYSNYIPATTPAYYNPGPVDLTATGDADQMHGDGVEDYRLKLKLSSIPIGAKITGIHVQVGDGNSAQIYGVGEGLARGLDGRPLQASQKPDGLVAVINNGRLANRKGAGNDLDLRMMTEDLDLNLYLPATFNPRTAQAIAQSSDPATQEKTPRAKIQVFYKGPQELLDGTRSRLWGIDTQTNRVEDKDLAIVDVLPSTAQSSKDDNGMLLPHNPANSVKKPYRQKVAGSLKEINLGFGMTLATAADSYSLDPTTKEETFSQFSERIVTTSFKDPAKSSTASNDELKTLAAVGSPTAQRLPETEGIIWVLDLTIPKGDRAKCVDALESLGSLYANNGAALAKIGLEIVGEEGHPLGEALTWADLDHDGLPELIIGNPQANAGAGEVVIIRGQHILNRIGAGGSIKRIDLSDPLTREDTENILILDGKAGSGFGAALTAANFVSDNLNDIDLVIGAPNEAVTITTDRFGKPLATPLADQSAGAVYLLRGGKNGLFTNTRTQQQDSIQQRLRRIADGALPQAKNYNYLSATEGTPRQFGAALGAASARPNSLAQPEASSKPSDLNQDGIADLVIGIPGLTTELVIVKGPELDDGATIAISPNANQDAAAFYTEELRLTSPSSSHPDDKELVVEQFGGAMVLVGGQHLTAADPGSKDQAKPLLLRGDTFLGNKAAAGSVIATGEDFDGDGLVDVAIGMPEDDQKTGAVSVLSGQTLRKWLKDDPASRPMYYSVVHDSSLYIQGTEYEGQFGEKISFVGDVNGDDKAELLLSTPRHANGTGMVSVLFGQDGFGEGNDNAVESVGGTRFYNLNSLDPGHRLDLYPGASFEAFGHGFTAADLNGDRKQELLLSTSAFGSNLSVLWGEKKLQASTSLSLKDFSSHVGVDFNVADTANTRPSRDSAIETGLSGDLNGDGYSDLVLRAIDGPRNADFALELGYGLARGLAPSHDDAGTGGNSVLSLYPKLRDALGGNSSELSWQSIQSAGDLMDDGSDDLLLGYKYQKLKVLEDVRKLPAPARVDSIGSSPVNERVGNLFDGNPDTKYLNFDKENSGIIFSYETPTKLTSITVTTANDQPERDPAQFELYGLKSPDSDPSQDSSWQLISSADLDLPQDRKTRSEDIAVANDLFYSSYRLLFPALRDSSKANSVQISEIEFSGKRTKQRPKQGLAVLNGSYSLSNDLLLQDVPLQFVDLSAVPELVEAQTPFEVIGQAPLRYFFGKEVLMLRNGDTVGLVMPQPLDVDLAAMVKSWFDTLVEPTEEQRDAFEGLQNDLVNYVKQPEDRRRSAQTVQDLLDVAVALETITKGAGNDFRQFVLARYPLYTFLPINIAIEEQGKSRPAQLERANIVLADLNGRGWPQLLLQEQDNQQLYAVPLMGPGSPIFASLDAWMAQPVSEGSVSDQGFFWNGAGETAMPDNLLNSSAYVQTVNELGDPGYADLNSGTSDHNFGYRTLLHLHKPSDLNARGAYSIKLGDAGLSRYLKAGESGAPWELKIPAYLFGRTGVAASREGSEHALFAISTGQPRLIDHDRSKTAELLGGRGFAFDIDEQEQTLRFYWNGKELPVSPQFPPKEDHYNPFVTNRGLHNNDGVVSNKSSVQRPQDELMAGASYVRYEPGAYSDATGTYVGKLVVNFAASSVYEAATNAFIPGLRPNAFNKGIQFVVGVPEPLALRDGDLYLTASATTIQSGSFGVHALAGLEFNTDKPLEGLGLRELQPAGDMNGDGYQDFIGLGSLATGWNYDYKLDLPFNNFTKRPTAADGWVQNEAWHRSGEFNAKGQSITRSTLIAPTIVWGSADQLSLDKMTPIVRGEDPGVRYTHESGDLSLHENFSSEANLTITPLGDFNGDGFDDLAIADREGRGKGAEIYIVFGGLNLDQSRSTLNRYGAFFAETRSKTPDLLKRGTLDTQPNTYIQVDDKSGFGSIPFRGINLSQALRATTGSQAGTTIPAFGGSAAIRIDGLDPSTYTSGIQLSANGDFNGDSRPDLEITSVPRRNAKGNPSAGADELIRTVIFSGDPTLSVNLMGTPGEDSLKGTPAAEVIHADAAGDIVQGFGGADVILAGPGDDSIIVPDQAFRRLDGGSGSDALLLEGLNDQTWDFTKLASADRIRNIESLWLNDYGNNTVILNAAAVLAMSEPGAPLSIEGDVQTVPALDQLLASLLSQGQAAEDNPDLQAALSDLSIRIAQIAPSGSDLSVVSNLLEEQNKDIIFDLLRQLDGGPKARPLDVALERLRRLDLSLSPGSEPTDSLDLAARFKGFVLGRALTQVSILKELKGWTQSLENDLELSRTSLDAQTRQLWQAALDALNGDVIQELRSDLAAQLDPDRSSSVAFERQIEYSRDAVIPVFERWMRSNKPELYGLPNRSSLDRNNDTFMRWVYDSFKANALEDPDAQAKFKNLLSRKSLIGLLDLEGFVGRYENPDTFRLTTGSITGIRGATSLWREFLNSLDGGKEEQILDPYRDNYLNSFNAQPTTALRELGDYQSFEQQRDAMVPLVTQLVRDQFRSADRVRLSGDFYLESGDVDLDGVSANIYKNSGNNATVVISGNLNVIIDPDIRTTLKVTPALKPQDLEATTLMPLGASETVALQTPGRLEVNASENGLGTARADVLVANADDDAQERSVTLLSGGKGGDRYKLAAGDFTVIADLGGGQIDKVSGLSGDLDNWKARLVGDNHDVLLHGGTGPETTQVLLIDPLGMDNPDHAIERLRIDGNKVDLAQALDTFASNDRLNDKPLQYDNLNLRTDNLLASTFGLFNDDDRDIILNTMLDNHNTVQSL